MILKNIKPCLHNYDFAYESDSPNSSRKSENDIRNEYIKELRRKNDPKSFKADKKEYIKLNKEINKLNKKLEKIKDRLINKFGYEVQD